MDSFAANIYESSEGEPVMALEALDGKPDMPSLILKSGNDAVFCRTGDQFIRIANIDGLLLEKLRRQKKILVAEISTGGETSGYYADVKELN